MPPAIRFSAGVPPALRVGDHAENAPAAVSARRVAAQGGRITPYRHDWRRSGGGLGCLRTVPSLCRKTLLKKKALGCRFV